MSEITTQTAETLAAEINGIKGQVKAAVLSGAVEIGRRLIRCKQLVPYGDWSGWLKEKVDFSERTAQNMMQLAGEYRDAEDSLLNISYTKALMLLGLPREERAEFLEQNDVESLSTRELQEEIKRLKAEKDALQLRFDELEDGNTDTQALTDELEAMTERMNEVIADKKEAEEGLQRAESEAAQYQSEAAGAKKKLQTAKEAAAKLENDLKQAEAAHQKEIEKLKKEMAEMGKPIIQQVTPPEVERELNRLREEAGRGQGESEARAAYDMLKIIFGKLEDALSGLDGETAGKYRQAFARSFRIMADKMDGGIG